MRGVFVDISDLGFKESARGLKMKTLTYKVEVSIPDRIKLSPLEIEEVIEKYLSEIENSSVYVQRIEEEIK